MPRFWEVDALRGIAIILMVFFHFLFDLNYFGLARISLYDGVPGIIQFAAASSFLLLVGVSMTLSYNNKNEGFEKRTLVRAMLVFSGGVVLSVLTLIFFPQQPILFGILHLIGASLLLGAFIAKSKEASLLIALAIILSWLFFDLQSLGLEFFFWIGFAPPISALDFFPVFPWMGAVFLGVFLGHAFYPKGKRMFGVHEPKNAENALAFLGRNSLAIYFIHQPVLVPMVYLAKIVFGL
ncbi:MAG: DUF1624 domain-containing protein [archaeon]|nr:DUF1624 domain-containing protein [archaeon]